MSDKVFVFGSFTEDETKSWLQKPSSKKDEKPSEKKAFQFGSLDYTTGVTFGDVNSESSRQQSPLSGNINFKTDSSPKKEKAVNISKKAGNLPGSFEIPKQNGSVGSIAPPILHSNGVKDFKEESADLSQLPLSQNGGDFVNQARSSKFHVLDIAATEDDNLEETNHVPQVSMKKEETQNPTDAPAASAIRNILPRGLINSGNLCFLNATLQALLACSPFVQLLQDLRNRNLPKAGFPTLTAFAQFISDLEMPSSSGLKKDPAVIETGRPFSPVMFEGVLKNFTPDVPNSMSGRPRQEDAQEFLSFIMDQMRDELFRLKENSGSVSGTNSFLVSSTEDEEWETVGPKNKSAVTRTQSLRPSELSDIFGGQLKSIVKASGKRDSHTVQPYLLLHLDIHPEAVSTIEDALRLFAAPENLEGYRVPANGKAGVVSARKSLKIQSLSKIMILHLMRFSYGSQGCTKLHKPVRFPLELVLGRELLASPTNNQRRKYELVATITHHGRDPSKGHYTADARYSNGHWLRFDDASVTKIGTGKVLHEQAYVLFYRQL